MNVPAGIQPAETTAVPDQAVSSSFAKEGARFLLFFVRKVKWSNGKVWKEDLEKIKKQATALSSRMQAANN